MSQTASDNRLVSLDVIRGAAVLAILAVNIYNFAWPFVAAMNPSAWVSLDSVDFLVWSVTHILVEQKAITLLSLLFGAGIALYSDRHSGDQEQIVATLGHLRRMGVLLFLGMVHAYALWYGDILVFYALCGSLAWFLRHRSTRTLIVCALILFTIPSLLLGLLALSLQQMPAESLTELAEFWQPPAGILLEEVAAYQGGWLSQLPLRAATAMDMQTEFFLSAIWQITAYLLLGMALYRIGLFARNSLTVKHLTQAGLALMLTGWLLTSWGLFNQIRFDFSVTYSLFSGTQWNHWGAPTTALGYGALLLAWIRSDTVSWLRQRLAAVGRLALSVYLLQTLVFTTIFYGHGLGLFAQVSAHIMLGMVIMFWATALWLAPLYLSRYRQGPLEWCWRRLAGR